MPKQLKDEELLSCLILAIKQLRKEKNVTLEHFYFDTGIHLARIEQGKTNITISTLSLICNYLEISLVDFFKVVESHKKLIT
jgi:transcriptional regulator with XRE-family HTH domain